MNELNATGEKKKCAVLCGRKRTFDRIIRERLEDNEWGNKWHYVWVHTFSCSNGHIFDGYILANQDYWCILKKMQDTGRMKIIKSGKQGGV